MVARGGRGFVREPGIYPAAYAITGAGSWLARKDVRSRNDRWPRPDRGGRATKDVTVPYDAETIDGKGLVVYPGFIDLYTTIGQRAGVERSATGKGGRSTWPRRP